MGGGSGIHLGDGTAMNWGGGGRCESDVYWQISDDGTSIMNWVCTRSECCILFWSWGGAAGSFMLDPQISP